MKDTMSELDSETGTIVRIAGPVVGATGLKDLKLNDVVLVGKMALVGEVIRLAEGMTTIQVYEDTFGIQVGEPVRNTGMPLVVQLGPGLLGQVYDGLQRPLESLVQKTGIFIQRGITAPPLPESKRWLFTPCVNEGDKVFPGSVLGEVQESQTITNRILVPPRQSGRVVEIRAGEFTNKDTVAVLETNINQKVQSIEITLTQYWPVRHPRPYQTRLAPREPIISGMRIIDTFFPVAKGGSAIIPGGFGTGKTVIEQSLARWANTDVVVYVGCGERGNEMTEVLEEFPILEDPRTGAPLMERTVLIANTSNMPVAAREASIYTGITIAEYYRDMGYDVLMLADSTSRWGEALREISGRLEEMPGEEGYPAYLGARLAEFYERSGRITCLGSPDSSGEEQRLGSVTIVGAVSPPGGDFSEPMTQNSMRVAGTFWALDYELSRQRHFPSINWTRSYTLYELRNWYANNAAIDWPELTQEALVLLQREVELLEIVQLVGPDALAETERAVLFTTRMIREDFLQQSAYENLDRFCPIQKAYWMLKTILNFHHLTQAAIKVGVTLDKVTALPILAEIARMREISNDEIENSMNALMNKTSLSFAEWGVG